MITSNVVRKLMVEKKSYTSSGKVSRVLGLLKSESVTVPIMATALHSTTLHQGMRSGENILGRHWSLDKFAFEFLADL
jgi:hypothetical protein